MANTYTNCTQILHHKLHAHALSIIILYPGFDDQLTAWECAHIANSTMSCKYDCVQVNSVYVRVRCVYMTQ